MTSKKRKILKLLSLSIESLKARNKIKLNVYRIENDTWLNG